MKLVLATHGTRDPAGARAVESLAARVRSELADVDVHVAYADVRAPSVADVLGALSPDPVVVVPAFLSSGYHVRVDLPEQVAASGHPDAVISESFGPDPHLVRAAAMQLRAAGYAPGDAVVLAAAGSSDPRSLAEVDRVAAKLSALLRTDVRVGFAATAEPAVTDAVRAARTRAHAGRARVAVASWLLAPGLFQRRVVRSGADVVADPLIEHRAVVDLVVRRFRTAQNVKVRKTPAGDFILDSQRNQLIADSA